MNRCSLIAAAALGLGTTAFADQLPGTLNFRNMTAQKIFQNQPEAANNEKEVEYGDFDNDSDLDVVIAVAYSDFQTRKNKLYINDGTGRFDEISATVPYFTTSPDVARNAFFRDYNLDGWLDMIIVCDNNTSGDPGRTKLYMNQHPGDVHTGWTEEGNARLGPSTGGAACGAFSADYDQDGDTELYVGNYPGPSQDTLYRNNGSAFFTAITASNVPVDTDYTVDVSSADLNGDGKLDLLVSNHGANKIYYNDNLEAGSEVGDFSYAASVQLPGDAATSENAMEPGDFDNDGDQDYYWSNYGLAPAAADRIVRNDGNNASNLAIWTFEPVSLLPPSVVNNVSRKATVSDLNDDGRVDVFVMKEAAGSSRPTVLRNTSVGAISFVDWTPADAFPTGSTHMGWHAAAFDADDDGKKDIFIGGWANDHLFFNVPANELDESGIAGGDLPALFNLGPVAVTGTIDPAAPDTVFANDLGANAFVSVVLNGPDDYQLQILDAADAVLATVNRGGLGVEEAIQYDPPLSPTTLKFRVTALDCAANVTGPCGMSVVDLLDLLGAWGPNPGHPADLNGDNVVDVVDLLEALGAWGETQYILEILSRSG